MTSAPRVPPPSSPHRDPQGPCDTSAAELSTAASSRPSPLPRRVAWLGLLAINLIALFALAAVAEVLTRRFAAFNHPIEERVAYNLRYRPSGFTRNALIPNQRVFALARDGRLAGDRRLFAIDRYGFRAQPDAPIPLAKAEDEIRVAFVGGSHVFDLHCVDADDCPGYPELVGRTMRAEGWPVRVLNAGVPGRDSRSFSASLSLDLHRFRPDWIVFASAWNDVKWMSRLDQEASLLMDPPSETRNPMVERTSRLDDWAGWSVLYRKSRDAWWQRRLNMVGRSIEGVIPANRKTPPDRLRAAEQYRQNFAAAIAVSQEFGVHPVLAIEQRLVAADNSEAERERIAMRMVAVDTHAELVSYFEDCDRELYDLSRTMDVPLIDLGPDLSPHRDRYFRDHVHTTPAGSRRLAAGYARELRGLFLEAGLQPRLDHQASARAEGRAAGGSTSGVENRKAGP